MVTITLPPPRPTPRQAQHAKRKLLVRAEVDSRDDAYRWLMHFLAQHDQFRASRHVSISTSLGAFGVSGLEGGLVGNKKAREGVGVAGSSCGRGGGGGKRGGPAMHVPVQCITCAHMHGSLATGEGRARGWVRCTRSSQLDAPGWGNNAGVTTRGPPPPRLAAPRDPNLLPHLMRPVNLLNLSPTPLPSDPCGRALAVVTGVVPACPRGPPAALPRPVGLDQPQAPGRQPPAGRKREVRGLGWHGLALRDRGWNAAGAGTGNGPSPRPSKCASCAVGGPRTCPSYSPCIMHQRHAPPPSPPCTQGAPLPCVVLACRPPGLTPAPLPPLLNPCGSGCLWRRYS